MLKEGSLARFTVNSDIAVMLFDDPVYHRKPEACALADFLGGKKRLEYPFSRHLIHPCPCVFYRQARISAAFPKPVGLDKFIVQINNVCS